MCVPPTGFGSVTAVISSPGMSVVSICGVSPGKRCSSAIGIVRVAPSARIVSTVASSALGGGKVGVAHQRANPQSALRCGFDLVQCEAVDVDQMRRRLDLEFHQVEQIGAAGNEFCPLGAYGGGCGLSGGGGALVSEGFHACLPATSDIASAMLE